MQETTPNHGPALERGIWVAVIIAALFVVLRVFAKIKISRFFFDDVLMIIASISAIVSTVFLTLSVDHGFGKPLGDPFTHDTSLVLKYIAIQIPIVTLSTTIARSSFIIYLVAVLGTKRAYKILLWVILVIQLAGNIVSAVLPLSICKNVNVLWDPTVKTTCVDSRKVIQFAYFSNTFNSATDLFLAVFPTVVFWNLNLKLRIKISLIGLLSLGIVAMVASIIKTTKLDTLPSITNLGSAGGIELIRWGYIENTIIIITSSIPCIRPLIISSVRKFSSVTRSYELSGPFSKGRGTGQQETTQPRKPHSKSNNPHDLEYGSIDHILEERQNSTATGGGRHSPNEGITKQIDIEVISDDEVSRSSSSRHIAT
ncbi:hypothetical protein PENSTE_c001G04951 [Penicillium steckii]|uniref:Rhodopsin domain-containing protein n=1 Tax=Penicillium steckii TaxID=303698 RepID=A0A1V6TZ82_9EURO|nr:hypothetical protein PENSTE_c001G04951 [Penicillium steckii]